LRSLIHDERVVREKGEVFFGRREASSKIPRGEGKRHLRISGEEGRGESWKKKKALRFLSRERNGKVSLPRSIKGRKRPEKEGEDVDHSHLRKKEKGKGKKIGYASWKLSVGRGERKRKRKGGNKNLGKKKGTFNSTQLTSKKDTLTPLPKETEDRRS